MAEESPYRTHAPAYQIFGPSAVEQVIAGHGLGSAGPEGAFAPAFMQGARLDSQQAQAAYTELLNNANDRQRELSRMKAEQDRYEAMARLAGVFVDKGMTPTQAFAGLFGSDLGNAALPFMRAGDASRMGATEASTAYDFARAAESGTKAGINIVPGQSTTLDPTQLRALISRTGAPLALREAEINARGRDNAQNRDRTTVTADPIRGETTYSSVSNDPARAAANAQRAVEAAQPIRPMLRPSPARAQEETNAPNTRPGVSGEAAGRNNPNQGATPAPRMSAGQASNAASAAHGRALHEVRPDGRGGWTAVLRDGRRVAITPPSGG